MSADNPLLSIVQRLTKVQLKRVADRLNSAQPLQMALSDLSPGTFTEINQDLQRLGTEFTTSQLAMMFLALSKAKDDSASELNLVWSGNLPGAALGRHTWVVTKEVVNEAREFIYAATYSAAVNSPAISALSEAIARGIAVTILVDPHHRPEHYQIVREQLAGARILGLKLDSTYATIMHAKFIMVDGNKTFITSANFSNAAATTSMELGVELAVPYLAKQIKDRVDSLVSEGTLEVIN